MPFVEGLDVPHSAASATRRWHCIVGERLSGGTAEKGWLAGGYVARMWLCVGVGGVAVVVGADQFVVLPPKLASIESKSSFFHQRTPQQKIIRFRGNWM